MHSAGWTLDGLTTEVTWSGHPIGNSIDEILSSQFNMSSRAFLVIMISVAGDRHNRLVNVIRFPEQINLVPISMHLNEYPHVTDKKMYTIRMKNFMMSYAM